MRVRDLAIAALLAAAAAAGAAPALADDHEGEEEGERPSRLEQAREEGAVEDRPPPRIDVPGGVLRVTSELLASAREPIVFEVALDRPADGERLEVDLPGRALERAESGIPFAEPPRAARRAGGRAAFRRDGRTVALAFDGARAGDVASFVLQDVGLPAGTYRFPYRWRAAGGRVAGAGVARVVLYAPTREEGRSNPWSTVVSRVEENVTNDTATESETFVSVAPGNRDRVVVGVNGGGGFNAWVSNDGGDTFAKRPLPSTIDAPLDGTETGSLCCDPMSAADAEGNVWYGGLSFDNGPGNPSRIVVNRLPGPAGTEFQPKTVGLPARTAGIQDKPMMGIDNDPDSPRHGRLYVVWNEPSPLGGASIVISECATRPSPAACDDADAWSAPVEVTQTPGSYIYGDVAAGPDGSVYVVWWDFSATNAIRGAVCRPGEACTTAAAWASPVTVARLDGEGGVPVPFACPILAQPGGRAAPAPQVETDVSNGPNAGRVYVTWGDLNPASGTTRCTDDGAPAASHDSWDAFVASALGALPGGASPSAQVGTRLLTDGEAGGRAPADDWFPWLAVDQTTGQAWADLYSTRHDASRRRTHFYVRGVTPTPTGHALGSLTRVSGPESDYSSSPCCGFGNDYGDYTGIDATAGGVYAIWSARPAGSDGEAFLFRPPMPGLVGDATSATEGGGDGDGIIESGEGFRLVQRVRNSGPDAASGVNATLSAVSGGVTVVSGTSTYPSMAVGATGSNAEQLAATIASSVPCAAPLQLALELATAQGTRHYVPVQVACSPQNSAPPPPPATEVTLGRARVSSTGTIQLRVRVSSAGRLTGTATASLPRSIAPRAIVGARTRIASGRATATQAGTVVLRLRPTRAGRTAFRRLRSVRATIRVSFAPASGTAAKRTSRATLRPPRR